MLTVQPTITINQIGKIQELFGPALFSSGLMSESVQRVIDAQSEWLVNELMITIRKHVEEARNMIIHRVRVDRTRTPQETLTATSRKQHVTNISVVTTMPKGKDEEVDVVFFRLGHWVSNTELKEEYKRRGLKPADPYSLLAVNEDDSAFADDHPNCTHWLVDGKWYSCDFSLWLGKRRVYVNLCHDRSWHGGMWFAGIYK